MKIRRQPITIKLPPPLKRWVKAQARKEDATPSAWIYEILRDKHEREQLNGAK